MFDRYGVSGGEDDNVLEMEGGDDSTTKFYFTYMLPQ